MPSPTFIFPPFPLFSNKSLIVRSFSVSFQQSSIHAIRSFSASFPARRSSVSAAMLMNNSLNSSSSKVLEKRSTNSTKPDDDERMPKRRLVRNKEDTKTASFDPPENVEQTIQNDKPPILTDPANSNIAANPDLVANNTMNSEEKTSEETKNKESDIDNLDLKSPKEKQCWNMYCKMTEKGINVSFDTILRGMLTPTEYRLSRRHSLKPTNTDPPKST
ncbi:unnamed protein product [Psylliodes chrysocephalus]|uniref:Uncharacterized protein n=1 Tax=Psylliodes chrysocephalus TaxID=3402493 RepID=A0A9P0CED2_9CUCU|nr:unnamed protein product [Psylliodes chrysocephala]